MNRLLSKFVLSQQIVNQLLLSLALFLSLSLSISLSHYIHHRDTRKRKTPNSVETTFVEYARALCCRRVEELPRLLAHSPRFHAHPYAAKLPENHTEANLPFHGVWA